MRSCQAAGTRPGDAVLFTVHLSDVLLVIKYLLVSASRSVLHIGQGADPAGHLELHLLVVNLNKV